MKFKSLLLLPFLLTGCTTTNRINDPFKGTKKNPVVYDEVASSYESPIKKLEPQSETNLLPEALTYMGTNVGPLLTIGRFETPSSGACPFTPEFFEELNYAYDSHSTGSSNQDKFIATESFNSFCDEFIRRFVGGTNEYILTSDTNFIERKNRIKKVAVRQYLGNIFKHTIKEYCNDRKSFYALSDAIGCFTYKARNLRSPKDYYTPEYLADLEAACTKNETEAYYALFDKYGTEYVKDVTFASANMMFMGFSSREYTANLTCREYNKDVLLKVVDDFTNTNPTVSLEDLWVNESEPTSTSNYRVMHYGTMAFYNDLPASLRQYEDSITEAYNSYVLNKLIESESQNANLGIDKETIKTGYNLIGPYHVGEEQKGFDIDNKKSYLGEFDILDDNLYYPTALNDAGFKKLYVRPRILLREDHDEVDLDVKIMIGGKKINIPTVKVDKDAVETDIPWYQIDTKETNNENRAVVLKVEANAKANINRCFVELVFSK